MSNRIYYDVAFNNADTDDDGRISTTQVVGLLESVGKPEFEEQLLCMMRDQGKSDVDYREFLSMMFDSRRSPGASLEIQQHFRTLDEDNSGFISADELRKAFAEGGVLFQGDEVPETEIEGMIKKCDTDGDGQINYIEFSQSFMASVIGSCVDGQL